MSFFQAYQLLGAAAREYQYQQEAFSTAEIVARINEIKYLSAQRKIPKLSLRKEILHLEEKVKSLSELEQHRLKQKHRESAQEKVLKKHLAELKRRLAATNEKDIHRKMDRITSLMGDYLARKKTEEEVKAAIAELQAAKRPLFPASSRPEESMKNGPPTKEVQQRLERLRKRVAMLRGEFELLRILKKEALARGAGEKIRLLEEKLAQFKMTMPPESVPLPSVERKEVKHTLLFEPVKLPEEDEELEMEKKLPLPPPPKKKA